MTETTASAPAGTTATAIAESATPRGRRARIALRGLQIVLALFYAVASALPKLIAHPSAAESFEEMGWGSAGMYAIGVLELAGAVALLIPVLQSVAAVALSALMVGAFVVQMTYFDGEYAVTPLILILPLALIAWARRGSNAELLRLVRRRHGPHGRYCRGRRPAGGRRVGRAPGPHPTAVRSSPFCRRCAGCHRPRGCPLPPSIRPRRRSISRRSRLVGRPVPRSRMPAGATASRGGGGGELST